MNQEGAAGNQRQADQDAALVAELARNQSGGNRHQEVSQIIGRLHEAGLFLVDVQRILKMLVQDVNHPVAKSPQQEQRSDQRKGDEKIFPVGGSEKAAEFSEGPGLSGWCNHRLVVCVDKSKGLSVRL